LKKRAKKIFVLSVMAAFLMTQKEDMIAKEIYTKEESFEDSNEKISTENAKTKTKSPYRKVAYHKMG